MPAVLARLEGDVSSDYAVAGNVMRVALIYVPAADRGRGLGSAELRRLVAIADERGWQMELDADSVFGVPLSQLTSWYTRHGFTISRIHSDGRARMVRAAAEVRRGAGATSS